MTFLFYLGLFLYIVIAYVVNIWIIVRQFEQEPDIVKNEEAVVGILIVMCLLSPLSLWLTFLGLIVQLLAYLLTGKYK